MDSVPKRAIVISLQTGSGEQEEKGVTETRGKLTVELPQEHSGDKVLELSCRRPTARTCSCPGESPT